MAKKYRGNIQITYELLGELLKLNKNEHVINAFSNPEREILNIVIESPEMSPCTLEVAEGAKIAATQLTIDEI